MQLSDLTNEQLATFINNYTSKGLETGGKFSLADLKLEKARRIESPFPPNDTAKAIVDLANDSRDSLVSYKQLWDHFRPDTPWIGNASQSEIAKALGRVIAYCVDNDLPILSTLVVRSDTRCHSIDAINNIYNEAKSLGVSVGANAEQFVEEQQAKSRSVVMARFTN